MEQQTPLELFWFLCEMSALSAIGAQCFTSKPLTLRSVIGAVLLHGPLGGGLGLYAIDLKGFDRSLARGIVLAAAYGAGVVSWNDIRERVAGLGKSRPPGAKDEP